MHVTPIMENHWGRASLWKLNLCFHVSSLSLLSCSLSPFFPLSLTVLAGEGSIRTQHNRAPTKKGLEPIGSIGPDDAGERWPLRLADGDKKPVTLFSLLRVFVKFPHNKVWEKITYEFRVIQKQQNKMRRKGRKKQNSFSFLIEGITESQQN